MSIRVVKFGGSCLATPAKIKKRAKLINSYYQQGHAVIVVVSAMGKQTNELVQLAYQVSPTPQRRELDMLLTTGERISMALVSMVLNDLGCPAISFTGSQAGVLTEEEHNNAKIKELKPIRVEEELKKGKVVIVAGFQGVNPASKEITTLGRGGSDTTALAFAKHFGGECLIFKDVRGVCNADPLVFSQAKTFSHLSHDQLIELCRSGSQVLHLRAAEFAKEEQVNYRIVYAEDPQIYTEISPVPNSHFKAITTAQPVTCLSSPMAFKAWLVKQNLSLPHIFVHEQQLYFWGDLETMEPIHRCLTAHQVAFEKNFSLISLLDDHSIHQRLLCSEVECKAELEKCQGFIE